MTRRCCAITLVILATFFLILALLLLFTFPLGIYPTLLKSQIPIKKDSDGQFTKSAYYWSKPPANVNNYYRFFHVQNPDDVLFFGVTPQVHEQGPYCWREEDERVAFEFLGNDTKVRFETKKTVVYIKEESCSTCTSDDFIVLPNLSSATMARLVFENAANMTTVQLLMADATALLLGIYPFSRVNMSEILYVGYTDNLLDFLQSDLFYELQATFGNLLGFDPPNIKLLGYFADFNHTTDGKYEEDTGLSKVENTGLIQKWRNTTQLSFWKTDETNNLVNATDGVVSGSFLKKKSLHLFQSLLCRHLVMNYVKEEAVDGIDSYRFEFDKNNFNPYATHFNGYSFDNDENVNYFPNWNHTSDYTLDNNNIPLPPGLVQQKCLPGRLDKLPFTAFASAPHFLNAPEQVQRSVVGLKPSNKLHALGEFSIQPKLGSTLAGNLRTQLSLALYKTGRLTSYSHSASVILPSFWLHTQISLKSYAHDFVRLAAVILPQSAFYAGIGFGVAALICVLLLIFVMACRQKPTSTKL